MIPTGQMTWTYIALVIDLAASIYDYAFVVIIRNNLQVKGGVSVKTGTGSSTHSTSNTIWDWLDHSLLRQLPSELCSPFSFSALEPLLEKRLHLQRQRVQMGMGMAMAMAMATIKYPFFQNLVQPIFFSNFCPTWGLSPKVVFYPEWGSDLPWAQNLHVSGPEHRIIYRFSKSRHCQCCKRLAPLKKVRRTVNNRPRTEN